jgi:hypothetical protein
LRYRYRTITIYFCFEGSGIGFTGIIGGSPSGINRISSLYFRFKVGGDGIVESVLKNTVFY